MLLLWMYLELKKLQELVLYLYEASSLIKNSAAKCCASAAEPPFPQSSNLLPFFIALAISRIHKSICLI